MLQCHVKFFQPTLEGRRASLFLFQLRFLGHEPCLGHVYLLELLIIVGTVSAGTDDQLEQLQLAFLQVPDLKLHGRQAHRLFFSGKDCRNTGFHRILGCLYPEQLIHGGDDGVVDVALIQSGRLLTDLPAMLQPVLAPPDDPFDPFLRPDHPAIRAAALPTDQQLAEHILSAVFPKLRLRFGGCFLQAGPAGQLLLYLLEGLPVNDGRVAVMDIVFGQFAVIHPLFSGEQVRDVGFL